MSHSLRRASRLGRPLPPFPRDACLGLLWQNIGSREVANHPFRPTTPVRPTKFSMSSFRRRNGVPARGSKTTKPSGCNTGQRLEKENRMLDAFFSLLGSLARAQIGLAETRHRNSRRKPPNSFGWRNAALIHTRKRPCAGDAHFATLC